MREVKQCGFPPTHKRFFGAIWAGKPTIEEADKKAKRNNQ
jgi:hypothetical protein